MSAFNNYVHILALSILRDDWNKQALADRIQRSLQGAVDPGRLAARLIFHFDAGQPPTKKRLIGFLKTDNELHQLFDQPGERQSPKILLDPQVMGRPAESMVTFPLPPLPTVKDLQLWLGLFDHELAWFADSERRQCKVKKSKLHHYHYQWIEKASGPPRLIEIPKSRLKTMQRQILREILSRIPPHPCAKGFVRGGSIKQFVQPHTGKAALLHMDLKDFFHTVPVPRIGAAFRRLGYPWAVAQLLQDLCTHTSAPTFAGHTFQSLPWSMRKRLMDKHLPQGAPTSPALANLAAWR
ncbi:MAG: reverse transcriptase family protein, partial [Candidatus Thiodiazotropha sp.]